MEKFSAFRDPGTGIQPFLTPVPPVSSDVLASILLPFGYAAAIVRTAAVVLVGLLYVLVVHGVCAVLTPLGPLHRAVTHLFTAILSRLVLLLVGLWWIPVEVVNRKRGRSSKGAESWTPAAGDVIVSNWASWIELLWLAFRFNPVFVLPATDPIDLTSRTPSKGSTLITSTPGRRTGTGSAAISSPSTRAPTPRVTVRGFREVSLLQMLASTGAVPTQKPDEGYTTLEEIRRKADRPVVVFPECTTSNGRGLLRFANVFKGVDVPVKDFQVFVVCVRYDPPTPLKPTLTHSIASSRLNPLSHIFKLTTSFVPLTLSIRLLAPSESPSSGTFVVSDIVPTGKSEDMLSEACASLIAQIGKVKRVGMGWEDKAAFLEFYKGKRK